MRIALLLTFLIACKTDADGDGFSSTDDCDDINAAVYPGAAEVCNGVDDDCDGDIDGGAGDATDWFADVDEDGHGAGAATAACEAPDGFVAVGDDCDDKAADVFPGHDERCDDVDNDCDGDVDEDAVDRVTLHVDADGDGYGDPDATDLACAVGDGLVDDDTDCDDDDAGVYPGADEVCDGIDNDCAGGADDGLDGTDPACPAPDCAALVATGWTSGPTYIDPAGTGTGTLAYCDMATDGGGWTLVAWNNNSAIGTGVPYPGLYVCSTLDCARGSVAGPEVVAPLIQGAASIAVGHTASAITTPFQEIADYTAAGKYDYGSLAGYVTGIGLSSASCTELAHGPYTALAGDTTYDGTTMYVAVNFTYVFGTYAEGSQYIWNIGAPTAACDGSGSPPGTWLGDWGQAEWGPTKQDTVGARSVWVR